MAKRIAQAAVATDGTTSVFVAPWTFDRFGFTPHVRLTVGSGKLRGADWQTAKLSTSDARRVAIAILEAAETADAKPKSK